MYGFPQPAKRQRNYGYFFRALPHAVRSGDVSLRERYNPMIRFLFKAVLAVPSLFLALSPRLWVFGFGVALEAVLFIYWLLRRGDEKPGKGALLCLSFLMLYLVYAFLLATISRKAGSSYRTILVPLKAWWQIFRGSKTKLKEVFYNICLLTPLGALVPPLLKYRCRWKDILFLAFLYTMAVECTQFLFKLGYFEIDDILHNCLGAVIGYGGITLLRRMRQMIRNRQEGAVPVPAPAGSLAEDMDEPMQMRDTGAEGL